jgi:hypothetical protein
MNTIIRKPLAELGYNFIPAEYIPKGKDEYYLRFKQNPRKDYKALTEKQIKQLTAAGNSSDNWEHVLITPGTDVSLIRNCKFFGLVRIGKLEPYSVEYHSLKLPVGLYNSTIISSDIGDYAAIDNVNFLSHYIVGNDVILVNINELACTSHSKYGNGILKKGEKENIRIWLELCNENAGRSVLPFDGMEAGDAWLWTRHRDDETLMQRFKELTEKRFDDVRGRYATIGDRTVIKNTRIIKDVLIGSDAYIKGANKLKNLTINSSAEARSQIGEGCELVNGIIGYGCRAFYGVKAVRFIMGSFSQLKYGARLINSFLGDNSTISCCEVLNSLIFPAHEQHHNNSFLCAALLGGQSNMAAGATIGSNHNSRGADGEIVAGRGFWPGLCVSLKHNSRFACFTLIAKGDFPAELSIPIPFSLISNDVSRDRLTIMPAYWFMYNMYALARNEGKYLSRDNRIQKTQHLEYDFLAPDSVNELFDALAIFCEATGKAFFRQKEKKATAEQCRRKGKELLEEAPEKVAGLEIMADGFENTKRPVVLLKVTEAYRIFRELIIYHGVSQLMGYIREEKPEDFNTVRDYFFTAPDREPWLNAGGQLIARSAVQQLIEKIKTGEVDQWSEIHEFYRLEGDQYIHNKRGHAFAALRELLALSSSAFTPAVFAGLLSQALQTREWMTENIYTSRAKDYANPFRKMVYETEKEMEKVIGALKDNSFILQQQEEQEKFRKEIAQLQQLYAPAKTKGHKKTLREEGSVSN